MEKKNSGETVDIVGDNVVADPGVIAEEKTVAEPDVVEKKPPKKKKVKSRKKTEPKEEEHPLEKFGPVRKTFILDNIRVIDYRDLARLAGVRADDLRSAVEKMGVKLPIERAKKWTEIDVGKYRSLMDCARCRVQLNHGSFYVGIKPCRKCLEKNIKLWIEKGIPIKLKFSRD